MYQNFTSVKPNVSKRVFLQLLRSYYSLPANSPQNGSKFTHIIDEFGKFCYQKDLPKAINAMKCLENHGLWGSSVAYSELIKCCTYNKAIKEGKIVHNHLISNGHKPKLFLLTMLINMYAKFNLLGDAEKLFDEMPERNVVTWTTMISAYSNAKIRHKALEFLVLMLRDQVAPNMYTFSSVLRACDGLSMLREVHCGIVKYGLESDVFVRSALIDAYAKWGELSDAVTVFEEFVTGDMVVWNSIIGAFAQNSDGNEALSLFKKMKRAGFPAKQATLTSTLRAVSGLTLLELGRQIHVHVLKYDKDLILNNALLDMYCKCGDLDAARLAFSQMVDRDVVSWSTMIAGLAQNGFSKDALALFEKMKVSGPTPNYITMVGVLFACSHAGLLDQGWCYFRSMKKVFGIEPGREHYGCMIDLLSRAGKLDDAVKLLDEMNVKKCEPDIVTWRTLLGACRVHRNSDLAIYAAKQILEVEPDDVGTCVLLSNIYENSQRWEDSMALRKTMREKGMKKEPGCSWIEVDKKIHAFTFRDLSHPRIQDIIVELNELIMKLRGAGYVPDTEFILQDLEREQKEDSLQYHSEKLAIVFGLMSLPKESIIRVKKNLRICGDCHLFAKLVAKLEKRVIVIRDQVRYHHFQNGTCSCGDYW
ncbi:pentatricopeptide repeat-containing protein At2g03880, mitochondrial [Silene latifolia]|uniref:pentatricopeptide repeat-containing protein At2g03880, mitochondrial n=1 Tax=Silene latifolia TaxID=37657 RepID=UPI003D788CC0